MKVALFPNNLTKEIDKGFSSLGGKVVALNNVVLLAIRLSFSVTANETLGVWDSDDLLPATSFPKTRGSLRSCVTIVNFAVDFRVSYLRHAVNCTKFERSLGHPPNCLRNLISRLAMWTAITQRPLENEVDRCDCCT